MSDGVVRQRPLRSSLMGSAGGAADLLDVPLPDHMLFGGSGHAFLLHADRALSRSSLHNWSHSEFNRLLANLGITHEDIGHFGPDVTVSERNRLERGIRSLVSRGVPCSVKGLEHQLITGYDEKGFLLDSPPSLEGELFPDRLDFGSWEQLYEHSPISFHGFKKSSPAPVDKVFADSLMHFLNTRVPAAGQGMNGFVSGSRVYDRWIAALSREGSTRRPGMAVALVMAECRFNASLFLREAAKHRPQAAGAALSLAEAFLEISTGLSSLSGSMPPPDMRTTLGHLRSMEKECRRGVEKVLAAFTA